LEQPETGQISQIVHPWINPTVVSPKETAWKSVYKVDHTEEDHVEMRRMSEDAVEETFQEEAWTQFLRIVFPSWIPNPDHVTCSSDGRVVVFWNDSRILVMKRHPKPHVIGSFLNPKGPTPHSVYVSCDWIEEDKKGLLVILCGKSLIFCWPLPQPTSCENRIQLDLEPVFCAFSLYLPRCYFPVRVSVCDQAIYIPSEESSNVDFDLTDFVVIRVPPVFSFQNT
jgi:hypothetical protein